MKKNKDTPELRFSDFERKWEEKKLDNFFSFKNGINASKDQYGKGRKFINVLDIIENDFITHENIKGKVDVPEEIFLKNEVRYGDVLFQRSSETREEVGQANVYLDKNKSATFGGFVIRGQKINDYDPMFMNYLLKTSSARKEITTKSGGSTRYNVGQEVLKEVKIFLPTLPEQQKIASFLSTIDRKIQQLRRKQALLEQYKKGLMQRIFKRELRFRKENGEEFGEWEEKKLEDIAAFSKGKGISKSDIVEDGTLECIRYGELYTHYGEVIDNVRSKTNLPKEELVLSQNNDVIIPASGETQIDIATASCVLKAGVALSGDLNIIKTSLNGVFFAYYINSAKKMEIAKLAQGNSVVHLYSKQLKMLRISIPQKEEQNKIARFLISIDKKINFIQDQITQTQTFKKGLLQQLFV